MWEKTDQHFSSWRKGQDQQNATELYCVCVSVRVYSLDVCVWESVYFVGCSALSVPTGTLVELLSDRRGAGCYATVQPVCCWIWFVFSLLSSP